jgi:hypothetical protein
LMAFMAAAGSSAPKDSLTIGLSSDASFLNALIASDGQSYKVEWSVFDCLVRPCLWRTPS